MSNKKQESQATESTDVISNITQRYHCPDCKGTTLHVNFCGNPDCPNMPCCGKPREECLCTDT